MSNRKRARRTPKREASPVFLPPAEMAALRRTIAAETRKAGYVRCCEHCGLDLYPDSPEPYGFFMLVEPVWKIVSLDGQIKCLCLACTEEVLGDRLPSWAFQTEEMAPVFMLTAELVDRLDPATDGDFNIMVRGERLAIATREFPSAEMTRTG